MASCSNPIAASASNTSEYYDVFLNHRGTDVKETLATHLYERLIVHGLRVFLDKHELHEGDCIPSEIKGAIRSASVHIAIFSAHYAESSWCLDELLLILDSKKTVIPIFYGVKPSELRSENGVYAGHLSILEGREAMESESRPQKKQKRYDTDTVKKWRKALCQASYIKGFEVEVEACQSYDMQLLDKVVKRVLESLPKTPFYVSKYPTGLDDKIKDLERTVLLPQESDETRVVGIVGLGGVGKTTLAKEFFNRERSKYDRSCFVPDIRAKAADETLNSLQSILLKELSGSEVQINSIDEGIGELKKRLSSFHARALIILDDVDHIDQLNSLLLPLNEALPLRCLILVTSRNQDVLLSFEIVETSIYKLEGLERDHSRELFCSHALSQPYPVKGFEQLVEEFLDACDGLPLSLQVIGALLRVKKDLNHWSAQLRKIKKILPEDIQGRLQISYNSLDKEEKQIFLDSACFFLGEDRDAALRTWDGSCWEGSLGFWKLENRCLVEVDSQNCIRMHDHLRDLGRYLAGMEHSGCRLLLSQPTDNLLPNLSGQSHVRGISLVGGNDPEQSFENLASSCNLSMLKLLNCKGDFVERVFGNGQLPQLIYLRLWNCPNSSLSSISIKNLRVLHITSEHVEILWQHEYQAPLQLRELFINAPLSNIPKSIVRIKNLEKFVLSHNDYLETLPNEFCNLHNLKHLELNRCAKLARLPDSFGNLTSLQTLALRECCSLYWLPDSVGSLAGIHSLDLSGCSSLQWLPDCVGSLAGIHSLDLSCCSSLQALPDSVGSLAGLQSLDLCWCSSLQALPDSVGSLAGLRSLELSGCSSLQAVPDSVGSLAGPWILDLRGCSSLQALPDFVGSLAGLWHLDLSGCSSLQALPDSVGSLAGLRSLYLSGCSSLQALPNSVGRLAGLESLDLKGCSSLQALPDSVGSLAGLRSLHLKGCSSLQALPDSVVSLTSLVTLDLQQCSNLQMLPRVELLSSLKMLFVSGCPKLQWGAGVVNQLRQRLEQGFDK